MSGEVVVSIGANLSRAVGLVSAIAPLTSMTRRPFASGSGAAQIAQMHASRRTIASAASDTLDLHGGGLLNQWGAPCDFATIRVFAIVAAATNTTVLTVGNTPANAWASWAGANTHSVAVRPNGVLLFVAPDATGFPVVAATADQLRITNAAGADATYDIVLLGA